MPRLISREYTLETTESQINDDNAYAEPPNNDSHAKPQSDTKEESPGTPESQTNDDNVRAELHTDDSHAEPQSKEDTRIKLKSHTNDDNAHAEPPNDDFHAKQQPGLTHTQNFSCSWIESQINDDIRTKENSISSQSNGHSPTLNISSDSDVTALHNEEPGPIRTENFYVDLSSCSSTEF